MLWPSGPVPKSSRTSSSPHPTPGTWTRRAPRPCTPRSGLGRGAGAYDFAGSSRSALGDVAGLALGTAGAGRTTVAVISDLRTGLAGSAEERDSGDAAAALVCAPDGAVAELIGRGAASDEFLDRWRVPGEADSHVWEERFGEEMYVPLAREAFAAALKDAGVAEGDVDHAVVTRPARTGGQGRHEGARRARRGPGSRPERDRSATSARRRPPWPCATFSSGARPGQVIVVLSLADGADALVLRTTDALTAAQAARVEAGVPSVAEQVAAGRDDLPYATFLTWRGQMRREPPRRPDPERPGAPTVHRSEQWKYAFAASRCQVCGFRHMPPTRACLSCHTIDQMLPERLADVPGTVATFTIDHLAFSLSPPVVGVIVDFDGGGRYRCE